MATPTFINFSRFEGSPIDALERVEDLVGEPWQSTLERHVLLRPSKDPYDGGLEAVGEQQPCHTIDDVKKVMAQGSAFGMVYLAIPTRAEFSLAFHDITKDGYTVTATIESSILYHKDDEYTESGRWFEGWLISLVTALQPGVCAYGNTYVMAPNPSREQVLEALRRVRYKALDPAEVLARLRTGELLELPSPVFHAISVDLVASSEIDALMKQRASAPRLAYKVSPGYHILSHLV